MSAHHSKTESFIRREDNVVLKDKYRHEKRRFPRNYNARIVDLFFHLWTFFWSVSVFSVRQNKKIYWAFTLHRRLKITHICFLLALISPNTRARIIGYMTAGSVYTIFHSLYLYFYFQYRETNNFSTLQLSYETNKNEIFLNNNVFISLPVCVFAPFFFSYFGVIHFYNCHS